MGILRLRANPCFPYKARHPNYEGVVSADSEKLVVMRRRYSRVLAPWLLPQALTGKPVPGFPLELPGSIGIRHPRELRRGSAHHQYALPYGGHMHLLALKG